MPVNDELGIRMKTFYEGRSKTALVRRMPVAIRLDMKCGHTFTRGFQRPFDEVFVNSMQQTAQKLCENIQGCVLSYQQSDEITLILCDYQTLKTDTWFDYEVQKLCSISASMATLYFNQAFSDCVQYWWMQFGSDVSVEDAAQWATYKNAQKKGAMFDARCFNIPKEEVTNLIYWRQLDATRNSIQMVGQANFSQKQLQGKSCNQIQDMLMVEKDINWNDFPIELKRGSCCIKVQDPTVDIKDGTRPIWKVDKNIPIFKDIYREYIESRINF